MLVVYGGALASSIDGDADRDLMRVTEGRLHCKYAFPMTESATRPADLRCEPEGREA